MNSFDRAVGIAQLGMLGVWEALGILAFDWNGWVILACWFVGIWSFNILIATAVRTYGKLVAPPEIPVVDEETIEA